MYAAQTQTELTWRTLYLFPTLSGVITVMLSIFVQRGRHVQLHVLHRHVWGIHQ